MSFSYKKVYVLFFLIFIVLIGLLFYFFTVVDESAVDDAADTGSVVVDNFGNENIRTLPVPDFPTYAAITDIQGGRRDDRVYVENYTETGSDSSDNTDSDDSLTETQDAEDEVARLTRVFVGPTAGYRIDKDDDGVWVVRIVEQGRGDRYIVRTNPYSIDFISAGEFTMVYEGLVFSSDDVLMLYGDPYNDLGSKSAFVRFAPTESDTIRVFEDNIRPTTNYENMLFFIKEVDDEVLGILIDVENPEETEVLWRSHFRNWIPRWGRGSSVTISSPISQFTNGYVYLLDTENDNPITRLANIPSGGSAFVDSSSGFFVLYESSDSSLVGKTVVTDQGRKTTISMPSTLPEKCDGFNGVFICAVPHTVPAITRSGHETMFPDSWYQGDIVLRDAIIQVDAITGEKKLIMSTEDSGTRRLSGGKDFDVIHPRISDDGKFLFFVDKNDLSLWMLRL